MSTRFDKEKKKKKKSYHILIPLDGTKVFFSIDDHRVSINKSNEIRLTTFILVFYN